MHIFEDERCERQRSSSKSDSESDHEDVNDAEHLETLVCEISYYILDYNFSSNTQ